MGAGGGQGLHAAATAPAEGVGAISVYVYHDKCTLG